MNIFKLLAVPAVAAGIGLMAGCASSPRFAERTASTSKNSPSSVARPRPTGKVLLTLEGVASYYADDFNGKQAANGEIFNMNEMVAAHRTFPFGTMVRVTNLDNKKQVTVRVIDRGPFKEGRMIDLSLGAAKVVDLIKTGTAKVRLEVIEWGDGKLYH